MKIESKRFELKRKLKESLFVELIQIRNHKRIIADFSLTLFVVFGAVLFYLFAPETYAVLKFFIVVMIIGVIAQVIERIGDFYTTKIYWLPEEERFVIRSSFQSRDFPIADLKEIRQESSPDLLKLHPLFTLLSANQDYTCSFQPVLKLSFPGEYIYMTPKEPQEWYDFFNDFIASPNDSEVTQSFAVLASKSSEAIVLERVFCYYGERDLGIYRIAVYTHLARGTTICTDWFCSLLVDV